ncbi:MAG: bifunctional adenosylcobinamide kinase/adenosylcobinamide-phosphate guanylyltransferase [Dehalococcoidia bacterium]|jgi:adenosylcobinamide kinase/adenosylcobinamide-phosphate guanylyltransferase
MNKQLVLILGGVRSGKSRYAQQLAGDTGSRVLFLATAEAGDDEMKRRIARHKSSRPESWRTIEEQLDIAGVLRKNAAHADAVIIDCVTVWLSNLLMRNEKLSEKDMMADIDRLIDSYAQGGATYIIVSGEVGMGIVPEHPLGRIFRDYLGLANQRLAAKADRVVLMVAGIPVDAKK